MTVYLYHVLQVLSHCDQESRLINQDPDVQYPLLHGEDRGWSGFFHLVLQASRVTGHGNDRPQLSGYITQYGSTVYIGIAMVYNH